ncbi:MAG: ATP-binding protein [Porticoccaceae bacterium]|nr:ATP-binding protein [Porticoccaceae bacterium]
MDLQISFVVFALLFLGIATLSQLRAIPDTFWQHPLIFALSFMGVSGVLFFFGAVEIVGRYGVAGLIGLAAFGGIFIFSPLFIDPLRWISRSHAFATLPDLLVYRFRAPAVAKASAALLFTASLPIAAAQFSIFSSQFSDSGNSGFSDSIGLTSAVATIVAVFIYCFGAPGKSAKALPGVTAFATTIALITLLGCGYVAVQLVFGGIAELNSWAETSGQDQVILRFDSAYALILLLLPMALLLPQQGFMQTLSNWWPKHSTSSWMVPFLLLLITLSLFPVLWAGLRLPLNAPLQQYVSVLPATLGIDGLYYLSLVTMLFISASLLTVTAIALGKIVVTSYLVKPGQWRGNADLDVWLNRRCFWLSCAWLVTVCLFTTFNKSNSVTDLSITGMIGVIQLLPGMIATLYAPKINRLGFLAGLAVGSGFWLYGVVFPVCFNTSPPLLFDVHIATGSENWPFWLIESLVANLLVALSVSMATRTSDSERHHGFQCMVDNLPTPQRQSLAITSLDGIQSRLATAIGAPAARRELDAAVNTLSISLDDHRPLAMRMLRDRLCFQLSAKLGTLTADQIMDSVMPFGGGAAVDDISLLESQLASTGSVLSGLAAELNKLRLYHRHTLENLPIGVCSLDSEGEILLWNLAMTKYTGLESVNMEGANIGDLPPPWGNTLKKFCASQDISWPVHEMEDSHRGVCWYHLSKHRIEENSPVYAGYQVVLMEDITERLRLIQELAHTERLTSVGRLAAGVAHEIGNPVTGISCLAQDLLAESSDTETRKSAEIILELTQRIATIVNTLMDFSRSDSQRTLKPIVLNTALNSAIQLLKLDKGAKVVEFRVAITEDFRVRGDLHQLTQVFVNLLANARDASKEGGAIEISGEIDGQQAIVHITDWGCGIPEEFISRVMDPFFTTKDPGEGTGLGLSMVYSIMRLHKGSVRIASPVDNGRGTRITLTMNTP